jgi:hypothetical protein
VNVGIVRLDELLLHGERGARFSELGKHRLEQRANGSFSFKRSGGSKQDGIRRVIGENALEVVRPKTLQVVVQDGFGRARCLVLLRRIRHCGFRNPRALIRNFHGQSLSAVNPRYHMCVRFHF